jgi:hypothetical protein
MVEGKRSSLFAISMPYASQKGVLCGLIAAQADDKAPIGEESTKASRLTF